MAFWFNSLEKANIKLPRTPKQGMFASSLFFDRYLASFVSTTVYNIIGLSPLTPSLIILSTCCCVLMKKNSFFSYSKFLNCDCSDKNILSRVSPVESEIRYTLYFSLIMLLVIIE